MRKILSTCTIILIFVFSIFTAMDFSFEVVPKVSGATIYVGGGGFGNYSTIQEGIDAADPGDSVFVYNGTYYGAMINKTITLIGEDMNTTTIRGSGLPFPTQTPIIDVESDWVNITGFTFKDSGNGINLLSSYNNVSGNIIHNITEKGIDVFNSSYNIISNNILFDAPWGIYLNGPHLEENNLNNSIFGNKFLNNSGIGIEWANEIDIFNNIFINSSGAIWLHHTEKNDIFNNYFSGNGDGITLRHVCNENNIYGNSFSNMDDGIFIMDDSNFNYITHNNFLYNNYGVSLIAGHSVSDNYIFHNNFINNTNQAYDFNGYTNYWDNGYPQGGNYWSDFDEPHEGAFDDYHGPEQDIPGMDGIVDNGTMAGGGKNPYTAKYDVRDNYPLIVPYGNYLYLFSGWNLLSIPNIQSDSDPITIFNLIKDNFSALQYYDASDPVDPWKHNHQAKPSRMNDLYEINHSMGLWIEVSEPNGIFFEYPGIPPETNQSIPLYKGWNMVGYPSLSMYNRTEALNNLTFGNQVDAVWTYNARNQNWEEIGESSYFIKGHGYWIHAKSDCVWEVPL